MDPFKHNTPAHPGTQGSSARDPRSRRCCRLIRLAFFSEDSGVMKLHTEGSLTILKSGIINYGDVNNRSMKHWSRIGCSTLGSVMVWGGWRGLEPGCCVRSWATWARSNINHESTSNQKQPRICEFWRETPKQTFA